VRVHTKMPATLGPSDHPSTPSHTRNRPVTVLAGRFLGPLPALAALCIPFKGPEPPVVTSGHPGKTHKNQRLSVAQGFSGGAGGMVELVGCVTNRVAHGSLNPMVVTVSHWGTGQQRCWVWWELWGPGRGGGWSGCLPAVLGGRGGPGGPQRSRGVPRGLRSARERLGRDMGGFAWAGGPSMVHGYSG
jgi:hypothetical protein